MIAIEAVQTAIQALKDGKMILLMDDKARENEGDLVIAAEKVTPEAINFMAKYGRGLITMPMMEEDFERLQLPMMVKNNYSKYETGFGVSFSAKEGVTTGISAFDRARSVQVAVNPASGPQDIVTPGHMFPLKARKGGVLARRGHT